MTFLNPLFLFALAAAAIPLIIHMFNFRRPRRIDFSSLSFLKELEKSTMQRVRIKQWLLLLLRTLIIACLVLAFARPTLTSNLAGTLGGRASTSMAVVLDNSLSMTLRDQQGAYLAQAKALAAGLVDETSVGDEVFVVSTGDSNAVTPAPYSIRSLALDALAEVDVSLSTRTLTGTLADVGDLFDEAAYLNREIYILSDLQQSTFTDSMPAFTLEGIRTYLFPIGTRSFANVAVTDVEVNSRIIEVGQPVQLAATLVNYGPSAIDDYVASVFLEGERVAQAPADLAPGVPATVRFTVTPQRRGWLAGEVRIEDDAFDPDNGRYFTLNVPERRRLLMVRGEEQRTEYVELALSPQLTRGRVAFDVETIDESALSATALGAFDAVVLVGPRSLSSGEATALAQYVEGGGGLLFFPSASAQAPDYNALLGEMGAGTFSGFSGSITAPQTVASFERVDLEHPLFEGVFDRPEGRGTTNVESPALYYAMNYTPGGSAEQTLIQLSNGFPFLQELRHGRGAAFLMAVAPDLNWSDLPRRGLFIPLLYRSMYYLSSGESVAGEQLVIGRSGELRITGVSDAEPLRIVSPDGEEFTPEQRTVFGALLLQTDATIGTPGIYDVLAGDDLVRRVAFNLDSRESDLQVHAPDEAARLLGERIGTAPRVLDATGAGGVQPLVQSLNEERTGIELWNVFLMIALFLLLAEMLVAKRWRPEAVPA